MCRVSPRRALTVLVPALPAAVVAWVVAAAALVPAHALTGIHSYTGNGYDDGVYLGASIRLLHGQLPYLDYDLLHPPGVVWLGLPFAALGGLTTAPVGLAAIRILTVVVAGFVLVNVSLRRWVREESRREAHLRDPNTHTVDYAIPNGMDPVKIETALALAGFPSGVDRVGMLFARVLAMEEAAFLGDWSFFRQLSELAFARPPLLVGLPEPFGPEVIADDDRRKAFLTARVSLTEAGRDVLAGRADRVALIGIDRWLGGTRIVGPAPWRYDPEETRLIDPDED